MLLLLSGCATGSGAGTEGSLVPFQPADADCDEIGPLAVRMSTDLVMPEDALLSSAVSELRRRAAMRGATHLVVAAPVSRGAMAYGTTAAASGVAYRCPRRD